MDKNEMKKVILDYLQFLERDRIFVTKWPKLTAADCFIVLDEFLLEDIDKFLDGMKTK